MMEHGRNGQRWLHRIRACAVVCAGAMVALLGTAQAQEPLHARISYEDGGALIKGSADAEWSYASVNTLALPGDSLWADQGGSIEVEMAGGTFLRLADGSKADLTALPPGGVIRGYAGSFYVQRTQRSTGTISFQTPAARISVEPDTHVRIDVVGDGATTVSVRWGQVSVKAEGGAAVVCGEGKRTYIDPGFLPSTPMWFDKNAEDGFDSWARERAKFLAVGPETTPKYVSTSSGGAPIGSYDLEPYGDWVYVDNTPYWRPTVVVDYVPYRSGYWSYVQGCGYTWVGSYPFCYVTSHYGRWTYNNSYGWIWGYQDTWAPAWAYTARCGDNFIWAPLDPWDRPCTYGSAYFEIGGVRISIGSSSYCSSNYLSYGPSYINPCGPNFGNYVTGNNVYIWNIYAPNSNINIGRRPYRDNSNLLVRDYSPQRSIRGLENSLRVDAGGERVSARSRAMNLEQNVSRVSFEANTDRQRGLRTAMREGSREARTRDVRVSSETQQETRMLASRDIGGWASETARNRGSRSGNPVVTDGERPSRNVKPSAPGDRMPADTSGAPTRTRADRDTTRGSGPEPITLPNVSRDRGVKQPPNATVRETPAPNGGNRTREFSSTPRTTTPRTTTPPADVNTRIPTRNVRGTMPDGGGSRGNSNQNTKPPRDIRSSDDTRQSEPQRTATPSREYRAPQNTKQPTRDYASERSQPRAVEQTTPRYEAPARERAPQRNETPVTREPEVRAPQREQQRNYEPPQRVEPQREYKAPQRVEQPRNYEPPQRVEQPRNYEPPQRVAPQVEAPQRSAPQYDAPRINGGGNDRPSRDVSAPSGRGGGGGDNGGGRSRSK